MGRFHSFVWQVRFRSLSGKKAGVGADAAERQQVHHIRFKI
jgi:hypothetical protein